MSRKCAGSLKIEVGSNDLEHGVFYDIARLIRHHSFNRPKFAYDIALLRVLEPIQFNEKIQPIKLSKHKVEKQTQLEFTGWGRQNVC